MIFEVVVAQEPTLFFNVRCNGAGDITFVESFAAAGGNLTKGIGQVRIFENLAFARGMAIGHVSFFKSGKALERVGRTLHVPGDQF